MPGRPDSSVSEQRAAQSAEPPAEDPSGAQSPDIAAELSRSRQDLLDLTLRNPLVSFRPLRAKGVQVVDELPAQVFHRLVEKKHAMYFVAAEEPPPPSAGAGPGGDEAGDAGDAERGGAGPAHGRDAVPSPEASGRSALPVPFAASPPPAVPGAGHGWPASGDRPPAAASPAAEPQDPEERHLDNKLQTAHGPARMDTRLRNTLRHARTSIEEQGVNILYLALGMLVWYESESSENPRRAPLVLVPVELDKAGLKARFKVKWTEEEIDANLSLDAKLSRDFDVSLPGLSDAEELDVDRYFGQVEEAVSHRARWAVDRTAVHLGFFSFSKLLIYKDLDADAWPEDQGPAQHPVVGALFGGGFAGEPDETAGSLGDSDEAGPWLDERKEAGEMHQVLDSDSSQTLAVMDAVEGRNLVVQGPPGTGKSQTITNLIAECVARGKTVLFVAEKMAALEVVKRRLDAVHAGDACLELHSHKANKAAVLAELKRTRQLGRPHAAAAEGEQSRLERSRDRLNQYARAVNSPVGRTAFSPQQLIGELARTGGADGPAGAPALELPDAASWSRAEFEERAGDVGELASFVAATGVPRGLPFWGSARRQWMPGDERRVAGLAERTADALRRHRADAERLAGVLGADADAVDADAAVTLVATAARISEAPALAGVRTGAGEWTERADEIAVVARNAREFARVRAKHDAALVPEAWEHTGWLAVRQGLASGRGGVLRFLSSAWRRAAGELRGLCSGEPPKGHGARMALVDAVLAAQRAKGTVDRARPLLERLFSGPGPGWDAAAHRRIGETAEWLLQLHQDAASGTLQARACDMLDAPARAKDELEEAASACRRSGEAWAGAMDDLAGSLELDEARFAPDAPPATRSFAELEAWLSALEPAAALRDIVRFNQIAARLEKRGLAAVAEAAAGWDDAGTGLEPLFRNRCCDVWISAAWRERPVLAEFDGGVHQEIVDRFRSLDEAQFARNQARVALAHWESVPRQAGSGQMGVLLREFEKKRRHMPVRALMEQAGAAVQAIKPVFMMSPLSIAKFVPPGSVRFDVVIFDEASQVRPVEAMGAIMRAGHAVVVGDSKQLPPTTFFDRIADDEDDEAPSVTADLESVLGLFCAQQAPQRMLRWHYRSRHESLIAVSNAEFYDGRLVVFPSPDKGRERLGLSLVRDAESFYRGGSGGRVNPGEAKAVARAVMRHARDAPDQTLGVAAFSLAQASRIEDELEMLRRGDSSVEGFFSSHPEEPFFVKNLENVQGDERDVILISVGYGRTEDGRMRMNFGPLNNDGGERRLNVLITRARRRCVVHANFDDGDLDMRRTQAQGVRALKAFLHYARTGQLDMPAATGKAADSPFEEAVAAALRTRGHQVEHQIGSAGFFVDLAVVDPRRPGRYLLGIECDGATYHSARSARDRDRLRQQVLEGLGWTIHRIWSTDWFERPGRETERAEEAIRRAAARTVSARDGEEPGPVRETAGARDGGAGNGAVAGAGEPGRGPKETVGTPGAGAGARARGASGPPAREAADGLRRGPPVEFQPPPDPSVPYRLAKPRVSIASRELHECSSLKGADWLAKVVAVESPVRWEEAVHRVARAAGLRRVGSRIEGWGRRAVLEGVAREAFAERGGFLWRPGHDDVIVRRRDAGDLPHSLRQVAAIAPEEIREALLHAVRSSHGIGAGDVVREAARLFGFKRSGRKLQDGFQQELDHLRDDGVLEARGDYLHVP